MATYVNNLRLKEITTGDEDGTWGTSTNTNLELIGEALGYGTKQMAADADETFTMPDASTDGTRSLYLKITSAVSLTTTRVVTLGPNTVSKFWIIENATSGGQIITIKQGSGATVNINNGERTYLYTDGAGAGAAVVNADPSGATGGTVTSVGGTGTVNGLTLTGTVTSSGNLTLGGSLSNVDLTSQVTGTLPIANGGTGTTSTTFVDLTTNVTGALPYTNGGTGLTSLGSAGQVIGVNTGGTALEYQTVSAGKVTRTATGAITAGDPVSINLDGTVTTVSETSQTESVGTIAYWETADVLTAWFAAAYDTTANKGLLVFNNGTANRLEAVVVTNTSGTLTYGTPVQIGPAGNTVNYTGICYNAAQDVFVVVYRDGGAGVTQAQAGEVVGTVTSWGTPVTITSANPGNSLSIINIDGSSNVLIAYDNNSTNSEVRTLSLSGTTVTVNAAVTMERSERGIGSLAYNSDNAYFVWAYTTHTGNYPKIVKITVSGTTPSIGTPTSVDGTNASGFPMVRYDPSSGNFLYAYSKEISSVWTPHFVILSESGGSFSQVGATQTVSANLFDKDANIIIERDPTNSTFAVFHWNQSVVDFIGYSAALVSGEIVLSENTQNFDANSRDEYRLVAYYDPDNSEYVVLFKESATNDGAGQVYTPAILYNNKSTYFGIAAANISDGASGDITIVSGLNSNVSGLTAGDFYYLADNGSLTTTSNGYPVGHALSATSILLDNVGYNAVPEQTDNGGKYLKTDGSNTSWANVFETGAIDDGSIVGSRGETYPYYPVTAVNYAQLINNEDKDFFVGVHSGADGPYDSGTASSRGFLTARYSSYWQKWFALQTEWAGSSVLSGARLSASPNGIDWQDVGSVRTLGNNNTLDKWSTDDLRRPMICFDESNGRMWIAYTEATGSFRLALAYVDLGSQYQGAGLIYGPVSGAQSSQVSDWFWSEDLQAILICYSNQNNNFKVASISAGGTTIDHRFSQNISGGDEKRMQMYMTKTDATTYKYYWANDSNTAHYWRETTGFPLSPTNLASNQQWGEVSQGDMSPTSIVIPAGTNIYWKDTSTNAWRDGSNWNIASVPVSGAPMYSCRYDPVKDDWIGISSTGFIYYSQNGRNWEVKGRCSNFITTRGYTSRKTTGKYPY